MDERSFCKVCEQGNFELVQSVIAEIEPITISWGLRHACKADKFEIVKLLVSEYAKLPSNITTFLNHGLADACEYDRCKIAQFLLDNGATDVNRGLRIAIQNRKFDSIRLMFEHDAVTDFGFYIQKAVADGDKELAEKLKEEIKIREKRNFEKYDENL